MWLTQKFTHSLTKSQNTSNWICLSLWQFDTNAREAFELWEGLQLLNYTFLFLLTSLSLTIPSLLNHLLIKKIGKWGGKWWWGWKMLSVSSLTRWSTVQMYNISYSYLFIFLLIFLFLYIFLVSNQKNIKERIILKIRKKYIIFSVHNIFLSSIYVFKLI